MSRIVARRVEVGGVALYVEIEGDGPPLLVLHGFTGSTRSMAEVVARLRGSYRTIRIDLVGHGRSDAPLDPSAYRMSACVAQDTTVLDVLELPQVHLLGYSMGGRVSLSLCAAHPERIRSAVLIGTSAGLEDETARSTRRRDDAALARRIERDGVEAFVDAWMTQPLFASQKRLGRRALAAAREERLDNRPHALALSLRGMGTGTQPPLHDHLSHIEVPICLVVGSEDARFRGIADDLVRRLPRAHVAVVDRAGHAAHLENPGGFERIVRAFLSRFEPTLSPCSEASKAAPTHTTKGTAPWPA